MTGLEKGKALFQQQAYNDAIIELDKYLAQHPSNADALYTRAICYRKIDQFEKSIIDLSTILERLPEEATLLCERGISHFNNKNIEAAMLDMNKAVELEPENPFRYSSRAYIRAKTDIEGAMRDYEKAIELDPKDEISHNNLGLLQENAGKMKAAKRSFNKSNEILGYDPDKRQEKISEDERTKQILAEQSSKSPIPESSVGKIMLQVFTSKKIRQEYFNFLKSKFKL